MELCLCVSKRIKNLEYYFLVKKLVKVEDLCRFGILENLYLFLDVTTKRGNSDQK